MNKIHDVFEVGRRIVDQIEETQSEALEKAAELISKALEQNHTFFVTGSGHSHTLTEEFYGRAGGLACVMPILTSELTLTEHPTKSTALERLPGYATILVDLYEVAEGDVVLVCSNSGRNSYPVEMALESKKRGATVIAVTNTKHSLASTSRHPSGKRLMEIADVVIDNCGDNGDATMQLDGLKETVCPTSSMANAFIAQAITVQVTENMLRDGYYPPVFASSNLQSQDNRNPEYFQKYTRMYRWDK